MREHTDGDFPFANDFNALAAALADDAAVVSGCSVTDGGTNDMTVNAASGTARVNGSDISVSAQSTTLTAADGSNDRYDLVVVDDTGSVTNVTGTASTQPAAPSIPANAALLAIVFVQAGASGVTDGDINDARGVLQNVARNGVPSGLIAMWSGSISNIPAGWVLCDGNNGTPNLQDRFVVGAGSTYAVDATGGASTVALTNAEMPSHAHDVTMHQHATSSGQYVESSADVDEAADSPASTQSAGSDSAHENKPPYHALAYIMKV